MSAVRRARSRSAQPSPYARQPAKKSSWSIGSLFRLFSPLSSNTGQDTIIDQTPESTSEHDEDVSPLPSPPRITSASTLSQRGHQMAHEITKRTTFAAPPPPVATTLSPPTTPTHQPPPSPSARSSSPTKQQDLLEIASILEGHSDISDADRLQLAARIRSSIPPESVERPRFRFSTSTPSTPARGMSPLRFGSPSSESPTKPLTKNPNGNYRWDGGGTARTLRSRNKYHSPSFGNSRTTPDRIVLKEQGTGSSPGKRRRVVDSDSSDHSGILELSSSSRSAAPEPSPTRVTTGVPFPAGSPGSPLPATPNRSSRAPPPPLRIRQPPPATPSQPSPLRQTWGGSTSPTGSSKSETSPFRQSKAASYMTELIKEVTPPKKPDLSNPYQAASPVKITPTVTKTRGKRPRLNGRVTKPQKGGESDKESDGEKVDEVKEYSAQAIIEATVPKGSKRSRPPQHIEKSKSPPSVPSGNPAPYAVTVEEVDDEEDEPRVKKKSKPNGFASLQPSIEVVDLDEQSQTDDKDDSAGDASSSVKVPTAKTFSPNLPARPFQGAFGRSSAPKEPSKLRFSTLADSPSPPSSLKTSVEGMTDSPTPGSKSSFSFSQPMTPPVVSTSVQTPSPFSVGSTTVAPSSPLSIPSPTPVPVSTSSPSQPAPQPVASTSSFIAPAPRLAAASSTAPPPPVTAQPSSASSALIAPSAATSSTLTTNPKETAKNKPSSSLPIFMFTCPLTAIDLNHQAAAKEAKLRDKSTLPKYDFSSPVLVATKGQWSCRHCKLKNSNERATQCAVCSKPRSTTESSVPASTPALVAPAPTLAAPAAAPAAGGFNWAGAGFKQNTNNWSCSTCMSSNPVSAQKCLACEEPR